MFLHDLRELEARLRTEKLAAMGRMSAAVAHEIRNPLAAIVWCSHALLEEDLHDLGQQLAQMVQQNAERLARIIADEVLDIARVQHQISHAPASALMLDETVALVWTDWQRQSPAQRHGRVSLMAEGAQVEFDAEHLRRVLFNLLDNALRYSTGRRFAGHHHARQRLGANQPAGLERWRAHAQRWSATRSSHFFPPKADPADWAFTSAGSCANATVLH